MSDFHSAIEQAEQHVGTLVGVSDWLLITQDQITSFGYVTLDLDPHHIDPDQAADGPFGTVVAQGFLILSLLTHFLVEAPNALGFTQNINYGFDRIRFVAPVPVESKVRGEFTLTAVRRREVGAQLQFDVTVRREPDEVVLVAQWLVLVLP